MPLRYIYTHNQLLTPGGICQLNAACVAGVTIIVIYAVFAYCFVANDLNIIDAHTQHTT